MCNTAIDAPSWLEQGSHTPRRVNHGTRPWPWIRFAVAALLGASTATAQQVSITLSISPHPSPVIAEWQSRRETASLTLVNPTTRPVQAQIYSRIELDGRTVAETDPGRMPVLTIGPGSMRFFADQIIPFSAIRYNGDLGSSILHTGRLPAGEYECCVELRVPHESTPLGIQQCGHFGVIDVEPPVLLRPLSGEELPDHRAPMFLWTPPVPNPPQPPRYQLKIVEVLPGQSPTAAFQSNPPVVELDAGGATQTFWPPSRPLPKAGASYAFQVSALVTESPSAPPKTLASEIRPFIVARNSDGPKLDIVTPISGPQVDTPCICVPKSHTKQYPITFDLVDSTGRPIRYEGYPAAQALLGYGSYHLISSHSAFSPGSPILLVPHYNPPCPGPKCNRRVYESWSWSYTSLCGDNRKSFSEERDTLQLRAFGSGMYGMSYLAIVYCDEKECWRDYETINFLVYDSTNCCDKSCLHSGRLRFGNDTANVVVNGGAVSVTLGGQTYPASFVTQVRGELCDYRQDQVIGEVSTSSSSVLSGGEVKEEGSASSAAISHGWTEEWVRNQTVIDISGSRLLPDGSVQEFRAEITWDMQTCNYILSIFAGTSNVFEMQSGATYPIAQLNSSLHSSPVSTGGFQNSKAWWQQMQTYYFGLLSNSAWLDDNAKDPNWEKSRQQYQQAMQQWIANMKGALAALKDPPPDAATAAAIGRMETALNSPDIYRDPGAVGRDLLTLMESQRGRWR